MAAKVSKVTGKCAHYHVVATGLWSGCLLGFSQNRFWGSILPPISSLKSHRAAPAFLCSYDITSQVSPSIKRFFYVQRKKIFYAPRFIEPGDICQRLLIL